MRDEITNVRGLPSELVTYVKDVERYDSGGYPGYPTRGLVTPEAGDRWSYGDWQDATKDDATHVLIRHATYGDYSNTGAVEASNYRVLLDQYPDTFIDVYGDFGTTGLMLAVDWQPPGDGRDGLLDELAALADYPVLDEEAMSEVEHEWTNAAIGDYLASDLARLLDDAGKPVAADFVRDMATHTLTERVWEFYSDTGQYPYTEAVESVVFPSEDDLAAFLAEGMPVSYRVRRAVSEAWLTVKIRLRRLGYGTYAGHVLSSGHGGRYRRDRVTRQAMHGRSQG